MRSIKKIISEIKAYETNDEDWLKLDELVIELWESDNPELGVKELFGVFEKHPTSMGAGVFWSILHGLERFDSCDENLVDSLNRKPSHMGIVMLKRVENTNTTVIAGNSIFELRESIKNNPEIEQELLGEL